MRFVRGCGALMLLLAGLFGVPWLLLRIGYTPGAGVFSWQRWREALLLPDDGSVLLSVITVVAWLAWLVFVLSMLAELVSLLSGRRVRLRVPGFGLPQAAAASLLLSVVAMVVAPVPPAVAVPPVADTSAPVPVNEAPQVLRPADASVNRGDATPATTRDQITYTVQPGDDLWTLAERFYGDGMAWHKIADANPRLLTGGPDELIIGWKLSIPQLEKSPAAKARPVRVRAGDTLSGIAARHYGDPALWTQIQQANLATISDPDQLEIGWMLTIPALTGPGQPESGDQQTSKSAPHRPGPSPTRQGPKRAQPHHEPTDQKPGQQRDDQPGSRPQQFPGQTNPPTEVPGPSAPQPSAGREPSPTLTTAAAQAPLMIAGVGGMLAAGLLAGFATRRALQLRHRPVGRRILHPPPAAQAVETALGNQQQPLTLKTLDTALRAIAAHCRLTGAEAPVIDRISVARQMITFWLAGPGAGPPTGFQAHGNVWLLDAADAGYLGSVPELDAAPHLYPALVSLGQDAEGATVLVDLEQVGTLGLGAATGEQAESALMAIAMELSFSWWSEEVKVTLVDSDSDFVAALDTHNVMLAPDMAEVLDRMELRAQEQRSFRTSQPIGQHRLDPNLADAWAPEVFLINVKLTTTQQARLDAVLMAEPRVAMAAVTCHPTPGSRRQLVIDASKPGALALARLYPDDLALTPQLIEAPVRQAVVELVAATGSEQTGPAPWWSGEDSPPSPPLSDAAPHPLAPQSDSAPSPPDLSAPDNVTFLRPSAGPGTIEESAGVSDLQQAAPGFGPEAAPIRASHPTVMMLGPIDLVGAQGSPPQRAAKQCIEYCAWLLERPGTTAQAMAAGLAVAEGTRRSNMSRLRNWLGEAAGGQPYLPDAYSGRILLHPSVSSDWQRLQILIGTGVNRSDTATLTAALNSVRGAPLADAAPGQWHWAEELRTDMASVIRDIGVQLTELALAAQDIDLARWAASRALSAAPEDELLLCARIRTEYQAGHAAEVERLVLQVSTQARILGVDLADETVVLLQQVMEGRPRSRRSL